MFYLRKEIVFLFKHHNDSNECTEKSVLLCHLIKTISILHSFMSIVTIDCYFINDYFFRNSKNNLYHYGLRSFFIEIKVY